MGNIYASFSGEIVTSSSVLDNRAVITCLGIFDQFLYPV